MDDQSIFFKFNNDIFLQNLFIIIDDCKFFQGMILTATEMI